MHLIEFAVRGVFIGVGATAVMDLWAALLQRAFGTPTSNWGLVGRWIGHFPRGIFFHESIASAAPIRGERTLGWTTHYVVGVAYALLLLSIWGIEWARQPSLPPALIVGLSMLVAPFFVMQPGMGAGIAGSRTPKPNSARLRSIMNHAVFGAGLYLSASLAALAANVA
jgi:hypothetical protein